MDPSRHLRVRALGAASAKSGDTCFTFVANPLLYIMDDVTCTEVEVSSQITVVNTSDIEVAAGDELSVCQDISGFWLVSGNNVVAYGFELTSNGFLTTETATADIYALAGPVFGSLVADEATIYDPSQWYAGAASGSRGMCLRQGGKYYGIQSACSVGSP